MPRTRCVRLQLGTAHKRSTETRQVTNSKHWFTTSFLPGGRCRKAMLGVWAGHTLQAKLRALVYDILPSTTVAFTYAIGSRKLSANEQFFVGAQTVVSLLQTTQIKQGVSFIAAYKVYTSANKNQQKSVSFSTPAKQGRLF